MLSLSYAQCENQARMDHAPMHCPGISGAAWLPLSQLHTLLKNEIFETMW